MIRAVKTLSCQPFPQPQSVHVVTHPVQGADHSFLSWTLLQRLFMTVLALGQRGAWFPSSHPRCQSELSKSWLLEWGHFALLCFIPSQYSLPSFPSL